LVPFSSGNRHTAQVCAFEIWSSVACSCDSRGVCNVVDVNHYAELRPNLAWAPTKLEPSSPPTKGQVVSVPPMGRLLDVKQLVMPRKGNDVFIAPSANVLGDVKLGSKSSIWYGAVLRGEQI
jgi:hypothetical protein